MSLVLQPVITQAGMAAIFSAQKKGLQASIASIGLGNQGYAVTGEETTLHAEQQRAAIANASVINHQQLSLSALVDGEQEYWIHEIGFYLSDGTLFALWSDKAKPLCYKAAGIDILLQLELTLTSLPADSVTIIHNHQPLQHHHTETIACLAATIFDLLKYHIQTEARLINLEKNQ